MKKNVIYNQKFETNNLPDKCAKLIIADPPYFEVKGKFDFVWESFEHYLKDVEKWAKECKRLLADNGTLLWYGDAKKIAYSQIIFDKYFKLLNSVVWENTNPHKQQLKFSEDLRSFAPLTERLLMYEGKSKDLWSLNLTTSVKITREYIRKEIERAKGKIIFKDVNTALGTATNGGGVASACLSLNKTEPAMITEEMYLKIRDWLNADFKGEFLRREYEDLRREYEDLRRPFNNYFNLGDVIKFPNFETSKNEHDTIKPEKLTRILIQTCSRPGDLVLVPFAGSGTECAMSLKEKREFIGFEIEPKYIEISERRIKEIKFKPTLF